LVRIQETRPLSKLKAWRLVDVLNPDGSVKSQSEGSVKN
jgi:ribosomal protein S17